MSAIAKRTGVLYTATMKTKHLRTTAAIFAAAGGKKAMAVRFGISHQAVCNWGELIPTGYEHRVYLWLRSQGYLVYPSAFGLRADGSPLVKPAARAA